MIAGALAASVLLGIIDFAAGVQSRKWGVVAILVVSQVVGFVVLLGVVALTRPEIPASIEFWLYALLAGTAQAVGVAAFWRALTVGVMGVVAPITAASGVVPVIVGLSQGDAVSTLQKAGLFAAIVGVVLASYEPANGEGRARLGAGVGFAVLAAASLGFVYVGLDGASSRSEPATAAFASRAVTVAYLLLPALVHRAKLHRARPAFGIAAAIGIGEIPALFLFLAASEQTSLSVAAVVTALYPLTTLTLARVFLREELLPSQWVGVGVALSGVAALSAG